MGKIEKYEAAILQVFKIFERLGYAPDGQFITDKEHRYYQFLLPGWSDQSNYNLRVMLHFQIKPDGKVWIWENKTAHDVAEMLIEQGVEKTDIVLAFIPEYVRQHTGYAVA